MGFCLWRLNGIGVAFVHNVLVALDIEGPVHHARADAMKGRVFGLASQPPCSSYLSNVCVEAKERRPSVVS